MSTKLELRRAMRLVRDALSSSEIESKSRAILNRLWEMDVVADASAVFVYVSIRSEAPTHDFIRSLWRQDRIVTVPQLTDVGHEGGRMSAVRITSWDQLTPGPLGILMPRQRDEYVDAIDVCIVPGLAFTESGDRLGYGQGHYDRFLADRPQLVTIALAFECQIVPDIPREPTDRRVEWIVTEDRTIDCARRRA